MPLQIIKPGTNINFIGKRKIAFVVSALLILLGLGSLAVKGGPKYGIDFAGGVIVQVKFDGPVELSELKGALSGMKLPGMIVQRFGSESDHEYLIRTSAPDVSPEKIRGDIEQAMTQNLSGHGFEIQRLEMVGPKVGADLRTKALQALFYAVLIIAIYISGRFEQRWLAAAMMAAGLWGGLEIIERVIAFIPALSFPMSYRIIAAMILTLALCWYLKLNYALGAVVALIHDVLITVGVFSLLNREFDLTTIAALLTIIGYSLNDTIIVFDRIRENIKTKISPAFSKTINISINQTLSRTILTSGTTLLVVLSLFIFGGGVIHDFALALLVGIVVGTYSSIYVASPVLLGFRPRQEEEKAPAK